jgi:chromosome segregation ATPase
LSVIDDLRKLLQDFIAPELRSINERIDNVNDRIKSLDEKVDYRFKSLEDKIDFRFDAVMKELATDKRLDRLERIVQPQPTAGGQQ